MTVDIRWQAVFADVPAPLLDNALTFWAAVTGWEPGPPQGESGEFVPLVPADGDAFLWLQRLGSGAGGWHLDLLVPDPAAAALAAISLGARVVRHGDLLIAMQSPQGQPFCLFQFDGAPRRRPAPPARPGNGRSLVDQLCLDSPFDAYEDECAFWAALTGWPQTPARLAEFGRIRPPAELPIQLLLQRLNRDDAGGTRAHLDMSADEPDDEVARHVGLGAEVVRDFEGWTTLHDPAGLTYCITHRGPRD